MSNFEILFVLYPGFDLLDFAGPYEVFSNLPNGRIRIASPDGGDLRAEHGITYRGLEKLADMSSCDLICIPGGLDQSRIVAPDAISDIKRLAATARYITSVCTGSLVLGAAGLLRGKRSTCHWSYLEHLENFGAIPDEARVCIDGNVITGAGVSSGIDFALTCVAEIAGTEAAQLIQLYIEYAPAPPFNSGSPRTAPPEVLDAFKKKTGYPAMPDTSIGAYMAPRSAL